MSVVVTGPVANWNNMATDRTTSGPLALRNELPNTARISFGKATVTQNSGKASMKLHFPRFLIRTASSSRRSWRNRWLAWGLYTWFMAAITAAGATTIRREATKAAAAENAV